MKTRRSIIAILLIFSSCIANAQTFVQPAANHSGGTTATGIFASNTTAGNTVVVGCFGSATPSDCTTPTTSSGSETWNAAAGCTISSPAGSTYFATCYYAAGISGGWNSVTCNYGSSHTFTGCAALEVNGCVGCSYIHASNLETTSGNPISGASETPQATGGFIATFVMLESVTASVVSLGAPFTMGKNDSAGARAIATGYELNPAVSSQTPPWTLDMSAQGLTVTLVMSPPTAGGGSTRQHVVGGGPF